MSQCVPSWDIDDHSNYRQNALRSRSNSTAAPDVPKVHYGVAELTWENGQLALHGLGQPRAPSKPVANNSPTKYAWEKPRANDTLESIVKQVTSLPQRKPPLDNSNNDELASWFNQQRAAAVGVAASMTMDALVPYSNRSEERPKHVMDLVPGVGAGKCVVDCSTRVVSCSGPVATQDEELLMTCKRGGVARVPVVPEWSTKDHSVTGSATFGRESRHMTHDTYDMEMGLGFTSISMGSPENTSSAKHRTKATTADDHDSVCHSRPPRDAGDDGYNRKKGNGKSSISTKRSRATAIHNQSERKRRDKINQRMKTLQKLVPNSSKCLLQTDKASMLDEVIEYLKQLQAQVQMMTTMSIPHIMLPMTMQQLQMLMMNPVGVGMGMGMGMGVIDMNNINRPNIPTLLSNPFLPMTSWDGSGDALFAFFACQSQPMTMDANSRMAAMYQQMQQPPASSSKN